MSFTFRLGPLLYAGACRDKSNMAAAPEKARDRERGLVLRRALFLAERRRIVTCFCFVSVIFGGAYCVDI